MKVSAAFDAEASRAKIAQQQFAIFGLGRSGLAAAQAIVGLGGACTVYDQAPPDRVPKQDLVEQVAALGAGLVLGWDGDSSKVSADGVIVNPAVRPDNPTVNGFIGKGIEVMSEIEFAYRICRAPIVAITGTNGKSTTTAMAWECLQAAGAAAWLCGNIYGSGYEEHAMAEAAFKAGKTDVLCAEVSSFQLEHVSQFRPVAAAITNVTQDHGDRGQTFREYAEIKKSIFRQQRREDVLVLDAANEICREAATEARSTVWTVGAVEPAAAVWADRAEVLGRTFRNRHINFPVCHDFKNAAVALLLAVGILERTGRSTSDDVIDKMLHALEDFKGIAHRMQRIGEARGIRFINNSMCTNPAALVSSLDGPGRPLRVLVGGDAKGADFTVIRESLADPEVHLYLYGKDRARIHSELGRDDPEFEDMKTAFAAAVQDARTGDTVILAPGCASQDQFSGFRERGDVFTQLAKDWLQS